MDKTRNNEKFINMQRVGNFTKGAVKTFEENIVKQKDYLEKVKTDDVSHISNSSIKE